MPALNKVTLWILVIGCMTAIFNFSSQTAEESSKLSLSTTEKIIDIVTRKKIPSSKKALLVRQIHKAIRKWAHFSLYFVLGIFVLLLILTYEIHMKFSGKWVTALLICVLYAASDEMHQMFVPGRGASVNDVLIDFSGSLSGSFLVYTCIRAMARLKGK